MIRKGTAIWNGSGKEGSGNLTTQSGVLNKNLYSHSSRFADGIGTNPEELIAAAHAGCFTIKLTFVLGEVKFTPESLETTCEITLENGVISKSHLKVIGKVSGISDADFQTAVKTAAQNCPVSKVLNLEITSEGVLLA